MRDLDEKREKIQQLIDDQSLSDQGKVFKLLLSHYVGEIDWPTYVHYCGILYSYFLANAKTPYERSIFEKDIESSEIINQLSSFHIWSDSYIQERRNWKPEKPMKAVFLKIMKVPEFDLPLKSEFSGCKSWIELNSNFQDTEWMVRRRRKESALEDDKIEKKLEEFKEIVK